MSKVDGGGDRKYRVGTAFGFKPGVGRNAVGLYRINSRAFAARLDAAGG